MLTLIFYFDYNALDLDVVANIHPILPPHPPWVLKGPKSAGFYRVNIKTQGPKSTTTTTIANFNTHANVDDDFYVFSRIDIDVNVT